MIERPKVIKSKLNSNSEVSPLAVIRYRDRKYTHWYPKSILVESGANHSNILHPNQKPVPLLEYLIKTYTLENETVLDNCMGSGTTGIACINTNRNFIGIEKDEKYFNISKKIIEKQLLFS